MEVQPPGQLQPAMRGTLRQVSGTCVTIHSFTFNLLRQLWQKLNAVSPCVIVYSLAVPDDAITLARCHSSTCLSRHTADVSAKRVPQCCWRCIITKQTLRAC
jgi:hypothetical protein